MLLLGYDIGSSSVKASVIEGESGVVLASTFFPKEELEIKAEKAGWAEQAPETWWNCLQQATLELVAGKTFDPQAIGAIGISYQMHGLVVVDKNQKVLRPSIIWCDSRAVEIGNRAFQHIGEEQCLSHLLNSPGNFTASKLSWVKEHEPGIFEQVDKLMLPGDYIAMKLTGDISTTVSGLSEGILWDFQEQAVADLVLNHYGLSSSFIPTIHPTFSNQGELRSDVAELLGLKSGIPVSYRAGDQPNNAFSLNVVNPGEIAATAGTSGVVYGVSGTVKYDPQSRVNSFAHVNHGEQTRLGVLLCVNGTGILNSWLKHNIAGGLEYEEMNAKASDIPIGSDGVRVLPFGNGAERVLNNQEINCQVYGLNFNRHHQGHVFRAAQEGIVFSFQYGMEIMADMGISPQVIRAGKANMFLSPIFRETLAGLANVPIELYNTDGAQGAARGAGVGCGYYSSFEDAFMGLKKVQTIDPDSHLQSQQTEAYSEWKDALQQIIS